MASSLSKVVEILENLNALILHVDIQIVGFIKDNKDLIKIIMDEKG